MVLPQEQEHLPAVHSSVSINLEGENDGFFRRHSFYYVFLEHSSSNVATFVACVLSSGNVAEGKNCTSTNLPLSNFLEDLHVQM